MLPVTRTQTGSLRQTQNTNDYAAPVQLQPRRRRKRRSVTEVLDSNGPLEIPRFTIDLSLPPEQRYLEVCDELKHEMRGLQGLFDEVVGGLFAWMPSALLGWVCWALLWRVRSREESRELKVSAFWGGRDVTYAVRYKSDEPGCSAWCRCRVRMLSDVPRASAERQESTCTF